MIRYKGQAVSILFWLSVVFFSTFCFSQTTTEKVRELENDFKFSNLDTLYSAAHNWKFIDKEELVVKSWLRGIYALHNSDHNEAYKELFEAYSLSKLTNNDLLSAEIAMDLAKVYSVLELTGRSLSLLHDVEKTFLDQGTDVQKARFFIQIGELYRRISNFDKAISSLDLAKQYVGDNQTLICHQLNRRAATYTELSKHEEAKKLSYEALRIAEEIDNPDFQALSYNELAFLGKHTEAKDSVLTFYTRADSLWTTIGLLRNAADTRLALSIYYSVDTSFRDFSKSLVIAYSALDIVKGKGWDYAEFSVYEHISNLHLELKAIDSSHLYKIKSFDAYIRFVQKRNDTQTMIVEAEYMQLNSEELIKEQRMKLIQEQEKNNSIRKENTLYFFITVISLLVILLLSVILKMNHTKRKKAVEIANNEAQIRLSLEQNLEEKNILLAEVNHRVKNNLQTMSSLIDLQRLSESSELVKSSLLETQRRIDAMGIIHEMLYSNEFMHKVDIRMYIKHLIESEKMIYEGLYDKACFQVDVDSIHLGINQCINLGMIISEFISNSFKHAFNESPQPEIVISLKQIDNIIELKISDNGRGISNDRLLSSETKSLGLKLITIFCKKLQGHHFLSGDAEGTLLTVSFPIIEL